MFAQSVWDIGTKLLSPDGEQEVVVAVRVTSIAGKLEEAYLLTNCFVWYSVQELLGVNNGK